MHALSKSPTPIKCHLVFEQNAKSTAPSLQRSAKEAFSNFGAKRLNSLSATHSSKAPATSSGESSSTLDSPAGEKVGSSTLKDGVMPKDDVTMEDALTVCLYRQVRV